MSVLVSTVTFKGKFDSDMMFTGTASWMNADQEETRDYEDTPVEEVMGEVLDAGEFVITVEKTG